MNWNIFSKSKTPVSAYKIDAKYLPDVEMKRVILHWTAGGYTASAHDSECYHFLIQNDGKVIVGTHSIADNVRISSTTPTERYAAHTRGCNTGSIGVSICAMGNAIESPLDVGKYPLTYAQWILASRVIATLCAKYSIAVTDKTVLSHAEVQTNLGIWQRGKWDVSHLTFDKSLVTAKQCGDDMRTRVKAILKG